VRFLAFVVGFGLLLYYPLQALATFNRSFRAESAGFHAVLEQTPRGLWVLIPALGGLAVGLLLKYVAPESRGHGVAEAMEAIALGRRIPGRVALTKALTAGVTIGTGGSAGREGPVVQMGAAVGNELAVRLGLGRQDVALLVACGGAAGVAASFNAPIAGAMFALEILLGDFGVRSFGSIVVAAVTATITSRALIGAHGEIARVQYALASGGEIAAYMLLGVFAGLAAVVYVKALHRSELFFAGRGRSGLSRHMARVPVELRPMLGGLLVGVIGYFVPRALGTGYATMNAALAEQLPVTVMLLVLGAKILTTALTLGSGTPGGSFFPAVFVGALVGGVFGHGVHALLPAWTGTSGAYATVGMAAVVGAATQGPLTAVVMLFELTRSYEIILPLMISCGVAGIFARRVLGGSMYALRLKEKGIVPPRAPQPRVLEGLCVADAMTREVETVRDSAPMDEVLRLYLASGHGAFPVVDAHGRLLGLLAFDEVREVMGDPELKRFAVARDLCHENPPTVRASETLEAALVRMASKRAEHLPVVAEDEPDRLVGILSRRDIMDAYRKAVAALESPATAEPDGDRKR
ncbi:MAG: chloride channel protein, partial [Myxococcales bacterium]